MITLLENKGLPPGGIQFIDPRIKEKQWTEIGPSIEQRARQVIEFRRQNPKVYDEKSDDDVFNVEMVKQEIAVFNYHRLGRSSPFFHVTDTPVNKKQACCNVPLVPRFCPSCSSKKLLGYRCPKCGKLHPV